MSQVIKMLRILDRKERFAVLRDVLGFDCRAPDLSEISGNASRTASRLRYPREPFSPWTTTSTG